MNSTAWFPQKENDTLVCFVRNTEYIYLYSSTKYIYIYTKRRNGVLSLTFTYANAPTQLPKIYLTKAKPRQNYRTKLHTHPNHILVLLLNVRDFQRQILTLTDRWALRRLPYHRQLHRSHHSVSLSFALRYYQQHQNTSTTIMHTHTHIYTYRKKNENYQEKGTKEQSSFKDFNYQILSRDYFKPIYSTHA